MNWQEIQPQRASADERSRKLSPHYAVSVVQRTNAEAAVDFYISIFKNSRRLEELRQPNGNIL